MTPRSIALGILARVAFWTLMVCIVTGAAAIVIVGYVPYLIFRTVFLTLTGRLGEATGRGTSDATDRARPA